MAQLLTKIIPSTEKCFYDDNINTKPEVRELTMLKNERLNFQLAFTVNADITERSNQRWLSLSIAGGLSEKLKIRRVDCVPVSKPVYEWTQDTNYLRREPGLYPDLLSELHGFDNISGVTGQLRALFITVEDENGIEPGEYELIFKLEGINVKSENTVKITVIDAELPKQELIHSQWFHNDCIATYYGCRVFSERHWKLIGNYMEAARRCGINMILTPVLTPPIDTAVGGERPTVQLVDITVTDGKYSFSYDKLDRYVKLALSKGMEYFEISHLFTQWGAKYAPKVMVTVDGKYKRIFGWETEGTGKEYRAFVRTFVKELVKHLKKLGIADKCSFHISDEPKLEQLEDYLAAKNTVADLLEGYRIMDALSDYDFYATGALQTPVPSVDHAKAFIEANVPEFWTYFCCGQHEKVPNRFMSMPGQRTRILGTQLFKYNAVGFLQWGYNFWYSQHSRMPIDPYTETCGSNWVQGGDAFSVYPGRDGKALMSLHAEHFYEALQDLRAYKLLESKLGHDGVVKLMEDMAGAPIDFENYPREQEYIHKLRAAVNSAIASNR